MTARNSARVPEIIRILKKEYPDPKPFLHFRTPLDLLVAVILSARCTDKRVNMVTPELFRKYPDARAYAESVPAELESDIHSTGFFRNKAKNIRAAAKKIIDDFGGKVPGTMEELLTLPGVARKTANIVLQGAFHKVEGIAVDVHVHRVSGRLGLCQSEDPEKAERELLDVIPREAWGDFNFWLVSHGRAVCQARKPKCEICALRKLCPYFAALKRGKIGS